MKLKEVKCYQTVLWNATQQGHFSVERVDKLRDSKLNIELKDGIVHVTQDQSHVMIPVNNIAYMIPLAESKTEPKTELKKAK